MSRKRIFVKINLILIALAIVSVIMSAVIINLPHLRAQKEISEKSVDNIGEKYSTTETSDSENGPWDVSKNGDGSVTAVLSADGTLTISGTGEMKDWSYSDTTDWHGKKIK